MTELEKIQRYIDRTRLSRETKENYCMFFSDMRVLYEEINKDGFGGLCLAFDYGRAKGY